MSSPDFGIVASHRIRARRTGSDCDRLWAWARYKTRLLLSSTTQWTRSGASSHRVGAICSVYFNKPSPPRRARALHDRLAPRTNNFAGDVPIAVELRRADVAGMNVTGPS